MVLQKKSSTCFLFKVVGTNFALCVFCVFAHACSDGGSTAQEIFNRGTALYFGMGGRTDREAACRLFEEAAARQHSNAIFNLGNCFREGHFGSVDLNRAEELYIESASLGVTGAFVSLGVLTLQESSNHEGYVAANRFFRIALEIDSENPTALFHYGISLLNGRGVAQDEDQAVDLMKRSSAAGYELGLATYIYLECDVGRVSNKSCDEDKAVFDQFQKSNNGPSYDEVIAYLKRKDWLQ